MFWSSAESLSCVRPGGRRCHQLVRCHRPPGGGPYWEVANWLSLSLDITVSVCLSPALLYCTESNRRRIDGLKSSGSVYNKQRRHGETIACYILFLCLPARGQSSIQSSPAPGARWLISLFRSRRVRGELELTALPCEPPRGVARSRVTITGACAASGTQPHRQIHTCETCPASHARVVAATQHTGTWVTLPGRKVIPTG